MRIADKVYGVDLDGVSFDFIGPFSYWLKKNLDIEYNDGQITSYYWHECIPGISEEDFNREFHRFGHAGMYEILPPFRDVEKVLPTLIAFAKDVLFITGRPDYAYQQTVNSLWNNFGVDKSKIIFSNGSDYKANAIKKHGVDVFLDDAPHYSMSIAINTDCKVYLMDATYNQGVEHENITRIQNWQEFAAMEGLL